MLGFDGISSTHPPSCLVSIYAENSSTTVPVLNYSVPLKGALNVKDMKQKKIVIIRSLSDILSSKTTLKSANYSDMLNFQAQLPTQTQLQQHLHLDLVQSVTLILKNVHKMLSKSTVGASKIYFQNPKQHFVV